MFFQYMAAAFGQVMILALLIVTGFICDKTGLFTESTARKCNDLLFYIITPAVIINAFMNVEFTPERSRSFLLAVLIAAAFFTAEMLLVHFLYRKSGDDRPIYQYATMYGNCGFMGLPLSQAVAGDLGVFYCSAAVVVFNVFAFTHGVALMQRSKGRFQLRKLLVNPGTIGIVIGLPLFLTQWKLPELLGKPLEFVGGMNTPLAMLLFGTYLAHTDLLGMFRQKENYLAAVLKLLIMPLASLGILWLAGVRGPLLVTCAVFCGAPSASNTAMFAAKFNRDTGAAAKVTGFTTMLSIFTLPLCIALANLIG